MKDNKVPGFTKTTKFVVNYLRHQSWLQPRAKASGLLHACCGCWCSWLLPQKQDRSCHSGIHCVEGLTSPSSSGFPADWQISEGQDPMGCTIIVIYLVHPKSISRSPTAIVMRVSCMHARPTPHTIPPKSFTSVTFFLGGSRIRTWPFFRLFSNHTSISFLYPHPVQHNFLNVPKGYFSSADQSLPTSVLCNQRTSTSSVRWAY
ncbi:hypothetical protein EDD22DRAFT_33828 [Suillus occidentalis]|nr:hypothetical protein EDD22DRAFT_33828 [Suillus occidentalis]